MRHFRVLAIAVATAIVLGVTATAATATSGAHFFSATASVADNGALSVVWDEAGVGNAQVNYTLTATSSATYACINGGGNHPKASNKETVQGSVSASGTFNPTNGRVHGSFTAGPLSQGSFTCPSASSTRPRWTCRPATMSCAVPAISAETRSC